MLLVSLMDGLFQIYYWLLIIRFILSWVPNVNRYHPLVRLLHQATDPVVQLFRGIIPPYRNVDFSPLILLLVLRLVYPLFRSIVVQIVSLF